MIETFNNYINKYKKIMKNDAIIGKLKHKINNMTDKKGRFLNKSYAKQVAVNIIHKYEYCTKNGKKVKYPLFKLLYSVFGRVYLGMYYTNFYNEFKNLHKISNLKNNRNSIISEELCLINYAKKYEPSFNDLKDMPKQYSSIQFLCISNEYNYAHLLFYMGRYIFAIHICNRLLKYLENYSNLSKYYQIKSYCLIFNLLFYLNLVYLYDVEGLGNQNAINQMIIDGQKFLSYHKKLIHNNNSQFTYKNDPLSFQVKSIKGALPGLIKISKSDGKEKLLNKIQRCINVFKVLFGKDNTLKVMNRSPYTIFDFQEWLNKRYLELNISSDLGRTCNKSIIPSNVNDKYLRNIKYQYVFALFQYFLGLRYYGYYYNYSISLMESSFINAYSLLDKIVLGMTMWTNKSSKSPLIYIVYKYNKHKSKKDFSLTYFHTFFSKKRMNTIFKKDWDNDPLQGLHWISKCMNKGNKDTNHTLVTCTDIRNTLMHRIVFLEKSNNQNRGITHCTDIHGNDNGSIIIDFDTFNYYLNCLVNVCRESIILFICFININGRHSAKFIKDELEKYQN